MDSNASDAGADLLAAQLDAVLNSPWLGLGLLDTELRLVRVNPALIELTGRPASELLDRTPTELYGETGRKVEQLCRQVLASGAPIRDVPLSTAEPGARSGEPRSWQVSAAPVRAAGGLAGLCVVVDDVTDQRRVLEALAESEGRHRRLAEDLQRSLLPPVLPRLAGAELASVYRPAAAGATVGGDFYDVIRLSPSAWVTVIGDVQGKGPVAASLTAAVRYAIRTATVHTSGPAEVLRTVNEVLLREPSEDGLCTVAYVLAERVGEVIQLRSAAAGHPLPLVVRHGDAAVEVLGEPGTLLGTLPDIDLSEASTSLAAGDALVLYTDGATEARFPAADGRLELFGDTRLRSVLSSARGMNAAGIAARLEGAVLDFQAGTAADDLALVVLRATTDTTTSAGPPPAAPAH